MHQLFCANWQKHLEMYLDETLNFNIHIKEKMSKAIKGIDIIKKFSKTLPEHFLVTRWLIYVSVWVGGTGGGYHIFSIFLFCFSAIVNCSFIAGT